MYADMFRSTTSPPRGYERPSTLPLVCGWYGLEFISPIPRSLLLHHGTVTDISPDIKGVDLSCYCYAEGVSCVQQNNYSGK